MCNWDITCYSFSVYSLYFTTNIECFFQFIILQKWTDSLTFGFFNRIESIKLIYFIAGHKVLLSFLAYKIVLILVTDFPGDFYYSMCDEKSLNLMLFFSFFPICLLSVLHRIVLPNKKPLLIG